MTISVWRLGAQILISALILNTTVTNNKYAEAELSVIPLWNVTINKTHVDSCDLTIHDSLQDVFRFTADAVKTCSVQLTTSNGTAALIRIPKGALVYAERQEDILNCQMKYISLTANEPCFLVSRHPKLQLFLQGGSGNGSSVDISQMLVNTSATICPDGTSSKGRHTSRVSQTNYCQVQEYDNVISCNLSPDYTCSFKFPSNCNVTLGNRVVELQCLDDNVQSSHKALTIYPPEIITLDLARQGIVELNVNPFMTLKSLKNLLLSYNNLVILPKNLLSGLTNLKYLKLGGNRLSSLNGNLFNETKKLTGLFLGYNKLKQLPSTLFNGLGHLSVLDLYGNDLTVLPSKLFMGVGNLEYLDLGGNKFKSLDASLLRGLKNLKFFVSFKTNLINSLSGSLFNETSKLEYLNLGNNNLKYLPNSLFRGLHDLEKILLYYNELMLIQKNLFNGLRKVKVLTLTSNRIEFINKQIFDDLQSLQSVYLAYNNFKTFDSNIFKNAVNLSVLNLAMNKLNNIPDISHLSRLIFLNLKGNKLTEITKETFSSIPEKTEIITSQHEICECYVSEDIHCTATDDRSPFLTCDRLLSDRILVVVMWLIGLNAIGGNIFVLSQKQKKTGKNKVQTFLLCNLAVSDLLMGVYMLLIASADISFGEYFPMHAEAWRSGITCRIAGTISILSSEASVFFVTLISIDRYLHIRYPLSRRTLTKKSSAVVVCILWISSLTLGIVPSSLAGKSDRFYTNSHVCIGLPLSKLHVYKTYHDMNWKEICSADGICYWKQPVESEYVGEVNGMIFASIMFLGLNFLCYLVILMCYVEIVRIVFRSSRRAGLTTEMKKQVRMTAKVAALVFTDFACWFPIIIIGILVQVGVLTLPADVFAWCVTFVLPINSAINPYLYTIAAIINSHLKRQKSTNRKSAG